MSSPSYRPNESDAVIYSEHTWLQGAFLGAVAYGIQVVLFFMSFSLLYDKIKRDKAHSRKYIGLSVYICIIYALGTLYVAALFQFTQQSFIDDRNFPDGPNAYENVMFSIPIDMLANVTMVLLSWMCDVINVWRCIVIYRGVGSIFVWITSTIPVLMLLGSVSLGIAFLKQVGTVSASPWDTAGVNFTIPYYSMSLSLNILVTILIATRLLHFRARINKVMGKAHGSHYTSLTAIIVESAALYSSFSILFLVPFAVGHPLSQLFIQALSPVQNVSTLLIIFRVAQGKEWKGTESIFTSSTATVPTIGGRHRPRPIQFRTIRSTFGDTTPERHDVEAALTSDVLKLDDMPKAELTTELRLEGSDVV